MRADVLDPPVEEGGHRHVPRQRCLAALGVGHELGQGALGRASRPVDGSRRLARLAARPVPDDDAQPRLFRRRSADHQHKSAGKAHLRCRSRAWAVRAGSGVGCSRLEPAHGAEPNRWSRLWSAAVAGVGQRCRDESRDGVARTPAQSGHTPCRSRARYAICTEPLASLPPGARSLRRPDSSALHGGSSRPMNGLHWQSIPEAGLAPRPGSNRREFTPAKERVACLLPSVYTFVSDQTEVG